MNFSTPTWSRYQVKREEFDESFSPIRPNTENDTAVTTSDGSEKEVARGGPTNLSNQLDGTGIAPAVQLSESTEERKLLGHTLDITGALVRNNILKRSRSLEDLRKVIRDNSLFRPFPMRENYVEEE